MLSFSNVLLTISRKAFASAGAGAGDEAVRAHPIAVAHRAAIANTDARRVRTVNATGEPPRLGVTGLPGALSPSRGAKDERRDAVLARMDSRIRTRRRKLNCCS